MTDIEIQTFIEIMEEHGDIWTEEQVRGNYEDCSFEEAINDRMASITIMNNIIATVLNR